ncbi:MAG: hypothetical protein KDD83_21765, partial [Caldilineaceae bacterium]|nr:hypothetical protein [Caldilineaceae bacterium]
MNTSNHHRGPSRRRAVQGMSRRGVAILAWILVALGVLAARPVAAQSDPRLTTDPTFGAPGDVITIIGSGYTPGGYPGIVFWDGVAADTLTIPDGGDFRVSFRVPIDASTDEHIVEV